jgi:signal transduction histidine kinase
MADITRIKQAEMALLEANALKDQLFSIIGHDLRSPIGSMNQMIEMYASQWKEFDEETSTSILNTLKDTSHETYKLLENLLGWAKSQNSSIFKPETTNLTLLTEQVITLSKGIAEGKNINIQKDLLPKALVMIDKEMINTVIRNLLSNSIKFTPHSGTIMVKIIERSDDYQLSIADSGVGIAPDILPKLFDNSSTYSTSGTNNEKGTGLGLKLVKKFIEKNSGQIFVESELGQGSIFTLNLPKYNNPE